ncbi:MAG: hypothetical protein ABIP11_00955 [Luteimonas sp.]
MPAKQAPPKVTPSVPASIKTAPVKTVPAAATATAAATTKPANKTAAKPAKSPGRKGRGDGGSEANLHKRVDSERIAAHIAAFEKSGGRVEKLGITRVLQKVSEAPATAPAQVAKTGGRRR